jgi:diaminopimelate epimerase
MEVEFTKMHGTGNDYVYVSCLEKDLPDPGPFSTFVSDRHFGIGSDGLVLILPSSVADYRMRMFNADGSEGLMCGNAIRCVGKFVYDRGLSRKTSLGIETMSGVRRLSLFAEGGLVREVEVDMGEAILEPSRIPVRSDLPRFVDRPVLVAGKEYGITCVSMGNPHAVVFVDRTEALDVEGIGPAFERHELFPDRINTEFVEVLSPERIRMRVWERGSGETMACGTGACAAVVATCLNGRCGRGVPVAVELRGGTLAVTYGEDGTVLMRGPATTVFDGVISYGP